MERNLFRIVTAAVFLLVTSAYNFSNRPGDEGIAAPSAAVKVEEPVAWASIGLELMGFGTLSSPVYLTHAGDGSGRIFIVERAGRIQLVKNGSLQTTPFLDISDHVRSGGEEGLLSMAFPPDYAQRGRFYIYYTQMDGDNVVARVRTSANPDLADSASEEPILEIPHPGESNHNGGQLTFGPEGYLYIGPGDGGGAGDPSGNAQNPTSLLGKVFRIDVEGQIPSTFPSLTQKEARCRNRSPAVYPQVQLSVTGPLPTCQRSMGCEESPFSWSFGIMPPSSFVIFLSLLPAILPGTPSVLPEQ